MWGGGCFCFVRGEKGGGQEAADEGARERKKRASSRLLEPEGVKELGSRAKKYDSRTCDHGRLPKILKLGFRWK